MPFCAGCIHSLAVNVQGRAEYEEPKKGLTRKWMSLELSLMKNVGCKACAISKLRSDEVSSRLEPPCSIANTHGLSRRSQTSRYHSNSFVCIEQCIFSTSTNSSANFVSHNHCDRGDHCRKEITFHGSEAPEPRTGRHHIFSV